VANGATLLIAGGMNNETGDKVVYTFLTARIIDMAGNHIKPSASSKHPDSLIQNDASKDLETRYLRIFPYANETAFMTFYESAGNTNSSSIISSDWKSCFPEDKVDWPNGSNVQFIPSINCIKLTNTPSNIQKLESLLLE
jgi:hypothetical protein